MCQSPVVFFVEDTKKEGEYEFLFKKIFSYLPNNFKVFSMNGKSGVKEIYKYIASASIKQDKYFYLVDGDFDILSNDYESMCDVYGKHFCFLDRYDIENYFIEKSEIYNYLRINCNATNDNLLNKINFEMWKENIKKHHGALFLLFFALHQFAIEHDEIQMPKYIEKYCHLSLNECGIPTAEKVVECKNSIVKEFCKINNNYTEEGFTKIIETYEQRLLKKFNVNLLNNISGKYMLHSLALYLQKIKVECESAIDGCYVRSVNAKELRTFLVSHINVKKFNFLCEKWGGTLQEIISLSK